jgi:Na+-transporting methylmalonyl-CoA/oxaloacetate decarboxylase gamma subunit|tara:strand:- start:907 stop:1134 length:228 start_codon:yes stop_codon:yes gene_type:complete
MENISNLSVLFNILLNGMITVFIVLSLVFFLGKAIIYFFDSNSDDNEPDIEGEINKEIKKMEGVDAKVVSYRKLD